MTAKSIISAFAAAACLAVAAGQAQAREPAVDYSAFRSENPRSILIVPVLNNTVNVNAPEFFLSTISQPFGNRGYYVFPAHMVKRILEDDGLADPGLVHSADPRRLGNLFGCDAVLYIAIQRWEAKYIVLTTRTDVKFEYTIKSCKTGETLWHHTEERVYVPQNHNTGNVWANLAVMAATAAMEKAAPNYMPLTTQANYAAAAWPGRGIPAGPYIPEIYQKDTDKFPGAASGSKPAASAAPTSQPDTPVK